MTLRSQYNIFRHWLRGHLYRMETGFMLNYLTLDINNTKVKTQLKDHRASRLSGLTVVFFFFAAFSFIFNLVHYLKFDGHPLMLLSSALTLASFILLFYWRIKG